MFGRFLVVFVAVPVLLAGCSDDGEDDATDVEQETTATEAATTSAVPGPNTVSLSFDDGETVMADVVCALEPNGEFAVVAESAVESEEFFGVTTWVDPQRKPEAVWKTADSEWTTGLAGNPLEVTVEGTTIEGSGEFANVGSPDEKRDGSFIVICAE